MPQESLKIFMIKFPGHWLSGDAVVVAEDTAQALKLLSKELKQHGLPKGLKHSGQLKVTELDASKPIVYVLDDGDY